MEGGEDGVVDVLGRPAADMTAAMQEDFEEADDARVVDLDAGIAHRADGDRKSKTLQQRKVDMDIEPLRLEAGKAIGDGLETLADGIEMVQSLFETEIGEVVGDQLVAQEGGELFVLLQKRVFEVGAEGVMAVLDTDGSAAGCGIDHGPFSGQVCLRPQIARDFLVLRDDTGGSACSRSRWGRRDRRARPGSRRGTVNLASAD